MGARLAIVVIVFVSPLFTTHAIGQTLLDSITFNGGAQQANGAEIVFEQPTEVTYTVSGGALDISVSGIVFRVKCPSVALNQVRNCVILASGGVATDEDGDGVVDAQDQCPGTSPGLSVNSVGCSAYQLDADNDGVSDALDLCPGTAQGAAVNSSGCSDAQTGSSATYCSGAASNVSCAPSVNFDSIYSDAGELPFTIPAQGVLSIPFTLDDQSQAVDTKFGLFQFTTNQGELVDVGGPRWHIWYSLTPAGPVISSASGCSVYQTEARANLFWAQIGSTTDPSLCPLPVAGGVVYTNFDVACDPSASSTCSATNPTRYNFNYLFDIARNAAPL